MTIVGVTGHSNITSTTVDLVYYEFLRLLNPMADGLNGMTCLARGADQAFAEAVIVMGGALTIVIPAEDYFDNIPGPVDRERCRRYLDLAKSKIYLPHKESSARAYLDASQYLVDNCEVLFAVWDGSPAGSSGTSDAVDYASRKHRDLTVVWPDGAARDFAGSDERNT